MSGPRDSVPLYAWPLVWASDAYWWAWRKVQHVRWLASIAALGRRVEREERDG